MATLKKGVTYDPKTKKVTVDTGVYKGVLPTSKGGYTVEAKAPSQPIVTGNANFSGVDGNNYYVAPNGQKTFVSSATGSSSSKSSAVSGGTSGTSSGASKGSNKNVYSGGSGYTNGYSAPKPTTGSAYEDFINQYGSENDPNYQDPTKQPQTVEEILSSMGGEDPTQAALIEELKNTATGQIDEEAIRKQKEAEYQAQLDSIQSLYADRLNQSRIQGQGRLGSSTAMQARGGLLGSDFGAAQTSNVQAYNTQQDNVVENEKAVALNTIFSAIRSDTATELAAKQLAKQEGAKSYLEYLQGEPARKEAKHVKAAQILLSKGVDPKSVSDAELKKLGLTRDELTMAYNELKAGVDKAADTEATAAETTRLTQAKTQADINKMNQEMSQNYERGGIIYNSNNEEIAKAFDVNGQKVYESGGYIFEPGTNRNLGPATKPGETPTSNGLTGGGATGDLRQYASQYPNEASLKNNNPAGITFNTSFANRLTQAGIQFTNGTNRPANEGGSYFSFPTIEEGMKAYDLLWSSPSYTNLTLGQALNRWNTGSTERGYGSQISGEVGVNANTKVSDMTPDQLRAVQMAQLKRESPGMYKILSTNTGNNGQTYSDSDIELLSELANMDASARNTALKAQGIPLKAVTDYMAQAKAGNIPPTESQKASSRQIMEQIKGIADIDWNDATGVQINPWTIPGTDRATAQTLINSLVSAITLPNLGMLKGPMSDKDLAFIQSASARLNATQSDSQFEKEIVNLYNIAARKNGMKEITKLSELKGGGATTPASTPAPTNTPVPTGNSTTIKNGVVINFD